MELLSSFVSFILHIDVHLFELANQYGLWLYAILFVIVFCETGLVVTPFRRVIPCCLPPAWWPGLAIWAMAK